MVSLYSLNSTTQQEEGQLATPPMTRASPTEPTGSLAQAELASGNHADSAAWLSTRGSRSEDLVEDNLGRRYERTEVMQDHGEAIQVARPAVKVTPNEHSDLAGRPNNPRIPIRPRQELYTDTLRTAVHSETPVAGGFHQPAQPRSGQFACEFSVPCILWKQAKREQLKHPEQTPLICRCPDRPIQRNRTCITLVRTLHYHPHLWTNHPSASHFQVAMSQAALRHERICQLASATGSWNSSVKQPKMMRPIHSVRPHLNEGIPREHRGVCGV